MIALCSTLLLAGRVRAGWALREALEAVLLRLDGFQNTCRALQAPLAPEDVSLKVQKLEVHEIYFESRFDGTEDVRWHAGHVHWGVREE